MASALRVQNPDSDAATNAVLVALGVALCHVFCSVKCSCVSAGPIPLGLPFRDLPERAGHDIAWIAIPRGLRTSDTAWLSGRHVEDETCLPLFNGPRHPSRRIGEEQLIRSERQLDSAIHAEIMQVIQAADVIEVPVQGIRIACTRKLHGF